jgi:hypothetical protein
MKLPRESFFEIAAADPDLAVQVEESSGSIVRLRRIDASELTFSLNSPVELSASNDR